MTAVLMGMPAPATLPSPFDLDDDRAYRAWRAWKLAHVPHGAAALCVPVADPRQLSMDEREALLRTIARCNVALYRSPIVTEDSRLPVALGAQLGLRRLDANWLAEEDGISHIANTGRGDGDGGYIPYTTRALRWHTDGYYHPEGRRIHGMILHCVRAARSGGANTLLDPDLVYIALRDEHKAHVRALMQPDAMTIPARAGTEGEARAAQSGPVFSLCEGGRALHMRYTARTQSIAWKNDAVLREALARLNALLAEPPPGAVALTLEPGMGIVGHNVLHERTAFEDDAAAPRLLYRGRFQDRCTPWPEGQA